MATEHKHWLGNGGVLVLGAALQAMPTIRFTELSLRSSGLDMSGLASIVSALRRPWGGGLQSLGMSHNILRDAGVVALAKALPPTLESLAIQDTSCGDDGLVAVAAALPALTHLNALYCGLNPVGARGWVALAGALPSLPALTKLDVAECAHHMIGLLEEGVRGVRVKAPGMGSEGAAALAAALPQCPVLRVVWADKCGLDESDRAVLRAAQRPTSEGRAALAILQREAGDLEPDWSDDSNEDDDSDEGDNDEDEDEDEDDEDDG